MSKKILLATLVVATIAWPASGDLPDGRGGRTSPQATGVSAGHGRACCHRPERARPLHVAKSPAELKAFGHLAWVLRGNDPVPAENCRARSSAPPRGYASSAELKALGHLARPLGRDDRRVIARCCDKGRCPMRSQS